jgi:hypothetical protein
MDRTLEKINNILSEIKKQDAFHRDTALRLVSLFREYIEENKLGRKHKTALFYGNWNVHTMLDRDPVPLTLDNISRIISDTRKIDYNRQISEELSLHLLRRDYLTILAGHNIAPAIFDPFSGWGKFLSVFLESLLEKPLKMRGTGKSGMYPAELVLTTLSPEMFARLDPQYITAFRIQQGSIFWALKVMPKDVTITGPLELTEDLKDFSRL